MDKVSKPVLTAAVLAVVGFSTIGLAATHAAGATGSKSPMSGIVQALATKFNLNPTDVQAVFTAERSKMQAQHEQNFKATLDAAVIKGTITKAQEDLIVAKELDQHTFMTSLKGKSQADRKTAMQANMTSLKAWATANSIPQQFVPGGFRGNTGGHWGHGHGMTTTPSAK